MAHAAAAARHHRRQRRRHALHRAVRRDGAQAQAGHVRQTETDTGTSRCPCPCRSNGDGPGRGRAQHGLSLSIRHVGTGWGPRLAPYGSRIRCQRQARCPLGRACGSGRGRRSGRSSSSCCCYWRSSLGRLQRLKGGGITGQSGHGRGRRAVAARPGIVGGCCCTQHRQPWQRQNASAGCCTRQLDGQPRRRQHSRSGSNHGIRGARPAGCGCGWRSVGGRIVSQCRYYCSCVGESDDYVWRGYAGHH